MGVAMSEIRVCRVEGKAYNLPAAWEPIKSLGSGAYATVASFQGPPGEAAVKKVEYVFNHPVLALRSLREVRLLAHFRHPNILSIHQLFVDSSEFQDAYLIVELMDGDLNQLIH